jgi:hypothetical protein
LAAIDANFRQLFLKDPLTAIHERGFTLEPEEERLLSSIQADNLYEFSQKLLEQYPAAHNNSDS